MTSREVIFHFPTMYNTKVVTRRRMKNRNPTIRVILALITLVGLIIALYFGNQTYVKKYPGGLDFLSHWLGMGSYLRDGINPYSDQTASLVDSGINEFVSNVEGNYRFVLPFVSLIFLAPFSLVQEFTVARAMWMTLLEASLLLSGFLIFRWVGHKRSLIINLVVMVVFVINYPALLAINNGSMTIIGFTLIILATNFIVNHQDEAAGLMLALSLVKPDLVYPIIIVILIWVIINKRYNVIWWFLATFVLMVGFSMVLIPSWPVDFIKSVAVFSSRNPVRETTWAPTTLEFRLFLVKNFAILILVIFEWFIVKAQGKRRFLWTSGLLMCVTPWIGGSSSQEYAIFIFTGLIIGLGFLDEIRKSSFSNWLLLILFFTGGTSWLLSGELVKSVPETLQQNFFRIGLPLLALGALYWSRWWVIQNEKFIKNYFGSS